MKFVITTVVLALLSLAQAQPVLNTAHGYLLKYGVPLAKQIKQSEDARAKAGVVPGNSTKFPWEAGIIIEIMHVDDLAVCSGSLVSAKRLLSAAHCWVDGVNQAWRYTVVLGSTRLFSGGVRVQTHVVVMHPNWYPKYAQNDIAVIQIPPLKSFSDTISPIALPPGPNMQGLYKGAEVTACGFGIAKQKIGVNNDVLLNHVALKLVDSQMCTAVYPDINRPNNFCTSGTKVLGPCGGDAGGPLTRVWNRVTYLIGIVSYSSNLGCKSELPSVYANVAYYEEFLKEYLVVNYLEKLEKEDKRRKAKAKVDAATAEKLNITIKEYRELERKNTGANLLRSIIQNRTTTPIPINRYWEMNLTIDFDYDNYFRLSKVKTINNLPLNLSTTEATTTGSISDTKSTQTIRDLRPDTTLTETRRIWKHYLRLNTTTGNMIPVLHKNATIPKYNLEVQRFAIEPHNLEFQKLAKESKSNKTIEEEERYLRYNVISKKPPDFREIITESFQVLSNTTSIPSR